MAGDDLQTDQAEAATMPAPAAATNTATPFLSLPAAVAAAAPDEGVAAHYGNPIGEQRALEATRSGRPSGAPAVVDLSHRGVISVTGPDRLS